MSARRSIRAAGRSRSPPAPRSGRRSPTRSPAGSSGQPRGPGSQLVCGVWATGRVTVGRLADFATTGSAWRLRLPRRQVIASHGVGTSRLGHLLIGISGTADRLGAQDLWVSRVGGKDRTPGAPPPHLRPLDADALHLSPPRPSPCAWGRSTSSPGRRWDGFGKDGASRGCWGPRRRPSRRRRRPGRTMRCSIALCSMAATLRRVAVGPNPPAGGTSHPPFGESDHPQGGFRAAPAELRATGDGLPAGRRHRRQADPGPRQGRELPVSSGEPGLGPCLPTCDVGWEGCPPAVRGTSQVRQRATCRGPAGRSTSCSALTADRADHQQDAHRPVHFCRCFSRAGSLCLQAASAALKPGSLCHRSLGTCARRPPIVMFPVVGRGSDRSMSWARVHTANARSCPSPWALAGVGCRGR
jgi:hypothetical protein